MQSLLLSIILNKWKEPKTGGRHRFCVKGKPRDLQAYPFEISEDDSIWNQLKSRLVPNRQQTAQSLALAGRSPFSTSALVGFNIIIYATCTLGCRSSADIAVCLSTVRIPAMQHQSRNAIFCLLNPSKTFWLQYIHPNFFGLRVLSTFLTVEWFEFL